MQHSIPVPNLESAFGASVVVCCYNSAARIRPTIAHLARQQTRCPWEVVIVDNASTDNTVAIAEQTWQEHGAPTRLRVVREARQGSAFARERGVAEAEHEYIIFCDDDNWLASDYVQQAVEIMDSRNDVGALGGANRPASTIEFPAWFWTYARNYAVGVPALESGDITARRLVWGAGMVLRRSVYRKIVAAGVAMRTVGKRGAELSTGEDGEICKWLILAGYRLWYDERLSLTHFVGPERLTKDYCRRLEEGNLAAGRLMSPYLLVINAAMASRWKRTLQFINGLARMCVGDRNGKAAVQAYSPIPSIVVDRATREVQSVAKRIRRRGQ